MYRLGPTIAEIIGYCDCTTAWSPEIERKQKIITIPMHSPVV